MLQNSETFGAIRITLQPLISELQAHSRSGVRSNKKPIRHPLVAIRRKTQSWPEVEKFARGACARTSSIECTT